MLRYFYFFSAVLLLCSACTDSNDGALSAESAAVGAEGQGGSWARFTVEGDYLYTVTEQSLNVFDIREPEQPTFVQDVWLGDDIETIYARESVLFIGSQVGMQIFSLRQPAAPERLSWIQHRDAVRCPVEVDGETRWELPFGLNETSDPVVADRTHAYLTLKTQADCPDANGNRATVDIDQLIVFDIRDLQNPVRIANYLMEDPEGLGLWNDLLFVCDEGLKVYDRTRPDSLVQVNFYDIPAYDVIPLYQSLLVTADDGFHQYDIRGEELEYVSSIRIGE